MKLIQFLGTFTVLTGLLGLSTAVPALAQDASNAAGSAAFSIGPNGAVYGAAVSAAIGENTAFAAAANTPEGSTAYAFGSTESYADLPNFLPDISGTVFEFGEGNTGFGIVTIVIDGANVIISTEATEEPPVEEPLVEEPLVE